MQLNLLGGITVTISYIQMFASQCIYQLNKTGVALKALALVEGEAGY